MKKLYPNAIFITIFAVSILIIFYAWMQVSVNISSNNYKEMISKYEEMRQECVARNIEEMDDKKKEGFELFLSSDDVDNKGYRMVSVVPLQNIKRVVLHNKDGLDFMILYEFSGY